MSLSTVVRRGSSARRLAAPITVGAAGLVTCVSLYVVDPNGTSALTVCPFKAATGLDCPACGGLRAVHDVMHGRLLDALDRNLLVALALPAAVVVWVRWTRRAASGAPRRTLPAWTAYALVAAILTFGVLRDVPGVPFLGSS